MAGLLLFLTVRGWHRGVMTMLMTLGTWLFSLVLTRILLPYVRLQLHLTGFGQKVGAALLLFVLLYIAMRMLMHLLDGLRHIALIRGADHLLGAALGFALGILALWLIMMILSLLDSEPWAAAIIAQIEANAYAAKLYNTNLLTMFIAEMLR